jgi:hypothetical protein
MAGFRALCAIYKVEKEKAHTHKHSQKHNTHTKTHNKASTYIAHLEEIEKKKSNRISTHKNSGS